MQKYKALCNMAVALSVGLEWFTPKDNMLPYNRAITTITTITMGHEVALQAGLQQRINVIGQLKSDHNDHIYRSSQKA